VSSLVRNFEIKRGATHQSSRSVWRSGEAKFPEYSGGGASTGTLVSTVGGCLKSLSDRMYGRGADALSLRRVTKMMEVCD